MTPALAYIRRAALIAVGLCFAETVLSQAPVDPREEPRQGTLAQRARELRAQGVSADYPRTIKQSWAVYQSDYDGLAKEAQLVVVATCRDFRYRLSPTQDSVQTLFIFDVEESVKGGIDGGGRILSGYGSLKPNQIIVAKEGGVLDVDGVRFTFRTSNYEPFAVGQRYILFLKENRPGSLGKADPATASSPFASRPKTFSPVTGPNGCLVVERGDDRMEARPFNDLEVYRGALQARFDFRLDRLLEHLRRGVGEK